MSGLATLTELAGHLRAALASDQTDEKLEPRPVTPTAFFEAGAMMTVTRHDDVIRVSAATEAGAAIACVLDPHSAAAFGLGLLTSASPKLGDDQGASR